jgi:uncharacterized membrane protein
MDRKDKTFILWSAIWILWFTIFIVLSIISNTIISLIYGISSFLILWFFFCDALAISKNID